MFPKSSRFLVVDSFETMRKIIKNALLELGYHCVVEADNGRDAWEKLRSSVTAGQPLDVVISDLAMPEMSGLDLLRHCRKDPELAHLPFLIITAQSDPSHITSAIKAGVSDYLVKPFDNDTLKAKLDKIYVKHLRAD